MIRELCGSLIRETPLSRRMFWIFTGTRFGNGADSEEREPCFQMVIDDIYAISKGRLVGRPQN